MGVFSLDMEHRDTARRVVHSLIVVTAIICSTAFAGNEEDYADGLKSFRDGDVVGAMMKLKKPADSGHAKSQALLGQVLDWAEFDDEALGYFKKAADQGDLDGMYDYGRMLASGEGVKDKDIQEGRQWLLKAAESGHRLAINVIADAYLNGGLGFNQADRNSQAALVWVRKAADNDYLPAVDLLSEAYRTGQGLPVDIDLIIANEYLAKSYSLRGIDPAKQKKRKTRRM